MDTLFPAEGLERSYIYGRLIGKGISGDVQLVADPETNEIYACKSIRKKLKDHSVSLENLEEMQPEVFAEIRGLITVSGHPKILQLLDAFENSKNYVFITELCQYGELFDFISAASPLPLEISSGILHQLASALEHCHSLGLVHRDIKPENVFISSWKIDGNGSKIPILKLGDFGSSKVLMKNEKTRQPAGTPWYMAPEIYSGESYSFEVDIWSLGVMFYIMLCGSFPFDGESEVEVRFNVLHKKLAFVSGCWARVSPLALDLLTWMLERDPERRATASDILQHPFVSGNCKDRKYKKT